MPKTPVSSLTKLRDLESEFKNECIVVENGCGQVVAMTKHQVKQHIATAKHKSNDTLKLKHQTLPSVVNKDEFAMELCEALVSANIPFKKLSNPTLRRFLEKRMQRKLPDESTIRKNYLHESYTNVIQKIREEIGENPIYVSTDETTDAEGRYIANVIVGALQTTEPSRPHLIHVKHLESYLRSTYLAPNTLEILQMAPSQIMGLVPPSIFPVYK